MNYSQETKARRARLRGHISAERTARGLQTLSTLAAVVALLWKGLPTALALLGLAGLFYLARPGPSEDLDRVTRR
jgi:hypothetical protein